MDKSMIFYKIRHTTTKMYSHGIIRKYDYTSSGGEKGFTVKWSKNGKAWTSEKTVKDHLMKIIAINGAVPSDWEIMEFTQQPSKPLHDWIDANMLCKMLTVK